MLLSHFLQITNKLLNFPENSVSKVFLHLKFWKVANLRIFNINEWLKVLSIIVFVCSCIDCFMSVSCIYYVLHLPKSWSRQQKQNQCAKYCHWWKIREKIACRWIVLSNHLKKTLAIGSKNTWRQNLVANLLMLVLKIRNSIVFVLPNQRLTSLGAMQYTSWC